MPHPAPALAVFKERKMAYLLLLGFSSGLPFYLTSQTLQPWLTQEGIDVTTIGFFSLVAVPYSLKFLWAPFLDRFTLPVLGRRRGWMSLSQVLLLVSIAAMALAEPSEALSFVAVVAMAVAFLSATQDIAIDAYRTDVLSEREMGAGAAVNVLGYRIALFLTGSVALILADHIPWPSVYLFMAACMCVGMAASFRGPEPDDPGIPPASLREAVRDPFAEFFGRFGAGRALLTFAFIALYKLGDAVVANMTTPFLLDLEFTQTDIGLVRGGMGLAATILGVFAGGASLSRVGILKSLWVFGLLQAGTNLLYFVLAQAGHNYPLMVLTINLEYFSAGLGTAAFVAFLMSLCNHRFTATQYALLSSFMAFSRDLGAAPAGLLAELAGWGPFFLISCLLALPGLVLLRAMRKPTFYT